MVKKEGSLIEYSIFDKKYKKILITGGLGFIGSALIFRLLNKTNSKIFNIDKLIQNNDLLSVNGIQGSLSEFGIFVLLDELMFKLVDLC